MRRPAGDGGSAVVEFVTLAVLLMVPVIYLVLSVGRVQAAAFAVEGASREAARSVAAAPDDASGARRAATAVRLALSDQGFGGSGDSPPVVVVRCSTTPCTQAEGLVRVSVEIEVVLPGVPRFLDGVVPARVPVRAEGVAVVDRFAGRPAGQTAGRTPGQTPGQTAEQGP